MHCYQYYVSLAGLDAGVREQNQIMANKKTGVRNVTNFITIIEVMKTIRDQSNTFKEFEDFSRLLINPRSIGMSEDEFDKLLTHVGMNLK